VAKEWRYSSAYCPWRGYGYHSLSSPSVLWRTR